VARADLHRAVRGRAPVPDKGRDTRVEEVVMAVVAAGSVAVAVAVVVVDLRRPARVRWAWTARACGHRNWSPK
jgi:hypothetical protein